MIFFVIISNNILLSLSIALIYNLIFISLYSWYIKPNLAIIWNWFFYITLLKKTLTAILLIRKYFIHYYTLLKLIFLFFFPLPFYNYWVVDYTSLFWIKPLVGIKKTWWLIIQFIRCHSGKSTLRFILFFILILLDDWSGHYKRSLKPWGK